MMRDMSFSRVSPSGHPPPSGCDQNKQALEDRFAHSIVPTLLAITAFNIADPKAEVPTSITEMLKDPGSREGVWRYLGKNGLPNFNLDRHQVHALVAGLLPYVEQDQTSAHPAVVRVAQCVTRLDSRDEELYQALGEFLRDKQLPKDLVAELSGPFRKLQTKNVKLTQDLLPWCDLFKAQADEVLLLQFWKEAAKPVLGGKFSSYDHLLSVVCGAEKVRLLPELERVLFPNQQESVPPSVDVSVSSLREFGHIFGNHAAKWSVLFIAVSSMDFAPTGVLPFVAVAGLGTALCGLASSSFQYFWRGLSVSGRRSALREDLPSYVSSRAFQDFKSRVYQKLLTLGTGSVLTPLIQRLEDDLSATASDAESR